MRKAKETLKLIDASLDRDGGAAYRQNLPWLLPKMEDAYRGYSAPFRSHLGASLLGKKCGRELWYSFHWASVKIVEPRLMRLFNRGHLEEARFLSLLKTAGFKLWFETDDGGQFKFSGIDGHFGSALDGVVVGIPELPEGVAAYAEFKTSADKGFQKIVKDGVANCKWEHYVQMQECMHFMQLPYALYMVVNKNDDSLHAEIIEYDKDTAERYLDRGATVIYSPEPLPMIHPSPGWWECKFCDFIGVCKKGEAPSINCRTCAHSTPMPDGTWWCERGHYDIINSDEAHKGCVEHLYNPTMLQGAKVIATDAAQNMVKLQLASGEEIDHGPGYFTSQDLKERGLK